MFASPWGSQVVLEQERDFSACMGDGSSDQGLRYPKDEEGQGLEGLWNRLHCLFQGP